MKLWSNFYTRNRFRANIRFFSGPGSRQREKSSRGRSEQQKNEMLMNERELKENEQQTFYIFVGGRCLFASSASSSESSMLGASTLGDGKRKWDNRFWSERVGEKKYFFSILHFYSLIQSEITGEVKKVDKKARGLVWGWLCRVFFGERKREKRKKESIQRS